MSQIKIDNKRSSLISSGLVEIERRNTPNSFKGRLLISVLSNKRKTEK